MSGWDGQAGYWSDVEAIELAFIAQWAHFGQGPLGEFHHDDGLIWTSAPVPQLPYNAVLRTCLGDDATERIRHVVEQFQQRRVQFMWVVHPTAEPADLARVLAMHGLDLVELATGMSLDLSRWQPGGRAAGDRGVTYAEVADDAGLSAYETLISAYWELAPESRSYVFGINRWAHDLGHGLRLVAFHGDRPVGKAYLSFTVGPDAHAVDDETAAVFGVFVAPEARGLGVASGLMHRLLEVARSTGRRRIVLHSSEMALPMYLRMGFAPRCVLPVYATTSLHSVQPS